MFIKYQNFLPFLTVSRKPNRLDSPFHEISHSGSFSNFNFSALSNPNPNPNLNFNFCFSSLYIADRREIDMGFLVTTLIFAVIGIIASLCTRICCNKGPSANLYISQNPIPFFFYSFIYVCGFICV